MNLTKYILKSCIVPEMESDNKADALKELLNLLFDKKKMTSPGPALDQILAREVTESTGIGKGIARVFAQAGAKVAILSRHADQAEAALVSPGSPAQRIWMHHPKSRPSDVSPRYLTEMPHASCRPRDLMNPRATILCLLLAVPAVARAQDAGPLTVLENPWMQYCVLLPREERATDDRSVGLICGGAALASADTTPNAFCMNGLWRKPSSSSA